MGWREDAVPDKEQLTRPSAIPSASGKASRSPVATTIPSRRLILHRDQSANQPADDRLKRAVDSVSEVPVPRKQLGIARATGPNIV